MPRQTVLSHTQIESRIRSIFSIVEASHGSLDSLNSQMHEVWREINSKTAGGRNRYVGYTRGFARGVFDALWHTLMQEKVEFVYRLRRDVPEINAKKDELFSTHAQTVHRSTEEFYAAGIGLLLSDAYHTHVWLGTDKPIAAWAFPRPSNLPQNGITRGVKLYAA